MKLKNLKFFARYSMIKIIMNFLFYFSSLLLLIVGISTANGLNDIIPWFNIFNKILRFIFTIFWLVLIQRVDRNKRIYFPMMFGFSMFFWGQIVDMLEDIYSLVYFLGRYENIVMSLGLGIASVGVIYWIRDKEKHEQDLSDVNDQLKFIVGEQKETAEQLKQLVNEKEILNKEIHHRVKNNLAVISSMLNLQAAQVENKEAKLHLQNSRDRVHSMALIHEQVYQSNDMNYIDFKAYIENIVKELQAIYGEAESHLKIIAELQDASMHVNVAVPCGLLLNELVTNAIKYAFPESDNDNRIEITLENQEQAIQLCVKDNGIGLPPEEVLKDKKSLGIKIVKVLAEQIKASITIERNKGTRYIITVPNS